MKKKVPVRHIQSGKVFESATAASEKLGIPHDQIRANCYGNTFSAKGSNFEFVDEERKARAQKRIEVRLANKKPQVFREPYTVSELKSIVQDFRTIKELRQQRPEVLHAIYLRGCMDDVAPHLKRSKRQLNAETIAEIAKGYSRRSDFSKGDSSAYQSAITMGIMELVCAHMQPSHIKVKKWTKARIRSAARKCSTRSEFEDKFRSGYNAARRLKILDQVCAHMVPKKGPSEDLRKIVELNPLVAKPLESQPNNYQFNYVYEPKQGGFVVLLGWLIAKLSALYLTVKKPTQFVKQDAQKNLQNG